VLAARLRRRQAVRRSIRFAVPAALAAGLALAFAWPHVGLHTHTPTPARVAQSTTTTAEHTTAAHATPDLATLQASSRQWQAWVQNLDRNGAPLDGQRLARAVALQDRIGLIDLQLSASRDPTTLTGLWQQRITLLQRLGLLHLQPYMVAEQAQPGHAQAISM
jgi:hypothetical protein